MSRRNKIWLFVLNVFFILDVVMHFVNYPNATAFSEHLNYIASVFMAFTIGTYFADATNYKENQWIDKQIKDSKN